MEIHCLYVASENFSQIRMCEIVHNAKDFFYTAEDNGEKTA